MAKKANPPGPLGNAPKPGFANPLYPTIGKLDASPPQGGYRSQINTQSPFGPALLASTAKVANPYHGYGTGAGDMTRSAFARSLTDTSRNAMNRSIDKFNVDYRTQAEKSRGEDILAQRQNSMDRYRMDTLRDVYNADVATGYDQRVKDLTAYQTREFKNADAKMTASILHAVGGLI